MWPKIIFTKCQNLKIEKLKNQEEGAVHKVISSFGDCGQTASRGQYKRIQYIVLYAVWIQRYWESGALAIRKMLDPLEPASRGGLVC